MRDKVASSLLPGIAGAVVFGLLVAGILAIGQGGRTEFEQLLRRTRGERVDERLTPAQAGYAVESRRDGRVVPLTIPEVGDAPVVFLNFWGTFCPPCIEELPSLLAMARARQQDVVVLAVSYDESWQLIDDFFKNFTSESIPPNFLVVRDPETVAGRDLKALFGTEKVPESYLLRNGVVEARYVNARDWTDPDFGGVLDELLGR
ncbi:MAG: TlpA family protein disulfide reductase [Deltaproteobacteria bacterium]|nr:TlpA family protein disulfide reductase [Deltaproteobacteria bacterium]